MTANQRPWQLEVFEKTLKKRQKYNVLQGYAGDTTGKDCLLVTCGDNNGAMNYHFRSHGGRWQWADVEGDSIPDIEKLLGEPVVHLKPDAFHFDDDSFDLVVVVDVLEHLEEDQAFLRELRRIIRPGGTTIITVPTDNDRKLANRLKERFGMNLEFYGHTRWGYSIPDLSRSLSRAGFEPQRSDSYIRPVTELVELGINFGYVFMLNRKSAKKDPKERNGQPGHNNSISPTTGSDFGAHGGAFRLYAKTFPVLNALTQIDRLLPFTEGHAVLVIAQRPLAKTAPSKEAKVEAAV